MKKLFLSVAAGVFFTSLMTACSTKEIKPVSVAGAVQSQPSMPAPRSQPSIPARQLQITNNSSAVVNTVKYKPCNAGKDVFLTLAENLKPKERIVFNLHDICIDLKALNAFEDTVGEKKSLSLTQKGSWDIR